MEGGIPGRIEENNRIGKNAFRNDVTHSAYISNTLYTMSDKYLKANDLTTLQAQASVSLPQPPKMQYPYPYYVD